MEGRDDDYTRNIPHRKICPPRLQGNPGQQGQPDTRDEDRTDAEQQNEEELLNELAEYEQNGQSFWHIRGIDWNPHISTLL